MKYMLISNNPVFACHAAKSGVHRIFVDLEYIGKKERQGHLDTFISNHSFEDISKIKKSIETSGTELLVRLNPFHCNTTSEIEEAIERGADILMLPMFTTFDEVNNFCELVKNRVKVIPLIETGKGLNIVNDIITIDGVSEVFFGLNDLHVDLNLSFMFELLANGKIEDNIKLLKSSGIPFGIGGIARIGEGLLSSEIILGEHLRLGSSAVILSRTFNRKDEEKTFEESLRIFRQEFVKLKKLESILRNRSDKEIEVNRVLLKNHVNKIVNKINEKSF